MFWQTDAARLAGEAIGSRQPSEATARAAVQARSVMEMKGKEGGGGNPCIQSSRGDTKEKSGSEGFTEAPVPPVVQHPGRSGLHRRLQPSKEATSSSYGQHEKLNLPFVKMITVPNTKTFIVCEESGLNGRDISGKKKKPTPVSPRRAQKLHAKLDV